jgi:hypothetical protein
MTTKAEAVNRILRRVGKTDQAEPSLTKATYETVDGPTGTSLASYAERLLDQENGSLQTRGWHWNTEYDVDLSPDPSTDKIAMPTPKAWATGQILRIDTYGSNRHTDVIPKDDSGTTRLFDLGENSFVFTSTITVTYVYEVRFDHIPDVAVDYLVAKTALIFNRTYVNNQGVDQLLQADISDSDVRMKQQELDSQDWNILDTAEAHRIRGRRKNTIRRNF